MNFAASLGSAAQVSWRTSADDVEWEALLLSKSAHRGYLESVLLKGELARVAFLLLSTRMQCLPQPECFSSGKTLSWVLGPLQHSMCSMCSMCSMRWGFYFLNRWPLQKVADVKGGGLISECWEQFSFLSCAVLRVGLRLHSCVYIWLQTWLLSGQGTPSTQSVVIQEGFWPLVDGEMVVATFGFIKEAACGMAC